MGLNLAVYAITVLLAIKPRTGWPGVIWLGISLAVNVAGYLVLDVGDPRKSLGWMLLPSGAQTWLFVLVRGIVVARREGNAVWLVAAWQMAALATFIRLTFFDGFDYTWWNWLIVIPINAFLAEIWPIYWLILRPLMGV